MNANEQINQTTDQLQQPTAQSTEQEVPSFRRTIGGTTYIVGIHFRETGKDTLADIVKRLMLDDIQSGADNRVGGAFSPDLSHHRT